jgi:hypothetical protein|tara:strand:+ start:481 stop:1251 length:771 start_codon:yes stop_codon:yes gene_type:complete
MKTVELKEIAHGYKTGDQPGDLEPTLLEDSLFVVENEPIGFYLASLPSKLKKLADIADFELNTSRVPKSEMKRSSGLFGDEDKDVRQYSCIIGSIPPKPHMRRAYATKSSVHAIGSARTFVKSMVLLGQGCLETVSQVAPSVYQKHKKAVESRVPENWRFADLFTSSISNYNIAAPMHRDNLNVKNAVNCIITRRRNCKGGNLHVPDYGTTFDSANNSLLVYPAWRNMHGVTPIRETHPGGYRNSLIWYALDSFNN